MMVPHSDRSIVWSLPRSGATKASRGAVRLNKRACRKRIAYLYVQETAQSVARVAVDAGDKFFYARETFHGAQNLYKNIDRLTGVAAMNQEVVYDQPGKKTIAPPIPAAATPTLPPPTTRGGTS